MARYATNKVLQLIYPPFTEYVMLHLQLLTGSDRFANMVEWLAWLPRCPL